MGSIQSTRRLVRPKRLILSRVKGSSIFLAAFKWTLAFFLPSYSNWNIGSSWVYWPLTELHLWLSWIFSLSTTYYILLVLFLWRSEELCLIQSLWLFFPEFWSTLLIALQFHILPIYLPHTCYNYIFQIQISLGHSLA